MDLKRSTPGRWNGPGGYRELLALSIPLILSTGSWSLQQFVDRMYLAWYQPESIAAAMPAGILNFTLFDTMNIIFSSALKGAGDIRFITKVIAALSWGVLVIPVGLAVGVFGAGLYTAWTLATLYVILLGLMFLLRFQNGA